MKTQNFLTDDELKETRLLKEQFDECISKTGKLLDLLHQRAKNSGYILRLSKEEEELYRGLSENYYRYLAYSSDGLSLFKLANYR